MPVIQRGVGGEPVVRAERDNCARGPAGGDGLHVYGNAVSVSFALAVLADSQPGFVADGFGNHARIVRQPRGIMDYN